MQLSDKSVGFPKGKYILRSIRMYMTKVRKIKADFPPHCVKLCNVQRGKNDVAGNFQ
jgi:hypothetical protein